MIKIRSKSNNINLIYALLPYYLHILFSFVKKSLERVCQNLKQQGQITSYDEPTIKGAFSKEKLQREIEWQRIHPGMDALLSHRKNYTAEIERDDDGEDDVDVDDDVVMIDSDEDSKIVPKKRGASATTTKTTVKRGASTVTARGITRGRGRGRGTSTPSLSMTTEASLSSSNTSTASKWPPRRAN